MSGEVNLSLCQQGATTYSDKRKGNGRPSGMGEHYKKAAMGNKMSTRQKQKENPLIPGTGTKSQTPPDRL